MNEGGMKAFREQQERERIAREFAESCEQAEIELRQLLRDLDTALSDWALSVEPSYVFMQIVESQQRIKDHGGTLVYIAALRERIKNAVR